MGVHNFALARALIRGGGTGKHVTDRDLQVKE